MRLIRYYCMDTFSIVDFVCPICAKEGYKDVCYQEKMFPGQSTLWRCNRCDTDFYYQHPELSDEDQLADELGLT
jgi:RecJ-like exonuclease